MIYDPTDPGTCMNERGAVFHLRDQPQGNENDWIESVQRARQERPDFRRPIW